jgi:hypothetical protein
VKEFCSIQEKLENKISAFQKQRICNHQCELLDEVMCSQMYFDDVYSIDEVIRCCKEENDWLQEVTPIDSLDFSNWLNRYFKRNDIIHATGVFLNDGFLTSSRSMEADYRDKIPQNSAADRAVQFSLRSRLLSKMAIH